MPRRIRIHVGPVEVTAVLNESDTAQAIWQALPITGRVNIWGDEIYFPIPVRHDEEQAQTTVALGDIAYWPPGHAFCIFFGPTPLSRAGEIRPASPVNVIGHVEGDATVLRQVPAGTRILIERLPEAPESLA